MTFSDPMKRRLLPGEVEQLLLNAHRACFVGDKFNPTAFENYRQQIADLRKEYPEFDWGVHDHTIQLYRERFMGEDGEEEANQQSL